MKKEKVLIATTNPAKKRYLKWVVKDLELEAVDLDKIGKTPKVSEKGIDFLENAAAKAIAYSRLVEYLTIATDGGLIVPALGPNWDSLLTHRFAGEKAIDLERVKALLEALADKSGKDRQVYFQEAIALARRGKVLFTFQARGPARTLSSSYDPNHFIEGFWIANLLYYPELGKKYTELTEEQRLNMSASHWAEMKSAIESFLRANTS